MKLDRTSKHANNDWHCTYYARYRQKCRLPTMQALFSVVMVRNPILNGSGGNPC